MDQSEIYAITKLCVCTYAYICMYVCAVGSSSKTGYPIAIARS